MTRLRTIAFLAVAGMGAAVTAERWIGSLLASGDGPDPTMKMVIAIDAPIETVWDVISSIQSGWRSMSEIDRKSVV